MFDFSAHHQHFLADRQLSACGGSRAEAEGLCSIEYALSYERSPSPAALFESKEIFRKCDKTQLAHKIENYAINECK